MSATVATAAVAAPVVAAAAAVTAHQALINVVQGVVLPQQIGRTVRSLKKNDKE